MHHQRKPGMMPSVRISAITQSSVMDVLRGGEVCADRIGSPFVWQKRRAGPSTTVRYSAMQVVMATHNGIMRICPAGRDGKGGGFTQPFGT